MAMDGLVWVYSMGVPWMAMDEWWWRGDGGVMGDIGDASR